MGSARVRRAATVAMAWLSLTVAAQAEELEIPEEYRAAVGTASQLGLQLWRHEAAGERANDALAKRKILRKDKRVQGWITDLAEGGADVLVTFIGDESGTPVALYRVRVPDDEGAPVIDKLETPAPLVDDQARRWRARQAAQRAFRYRDGHCSEQYRPVVLPRVEGTERTFVYLLALVENSDAIVAGGHYRYEYNAEGTIMEANRPFTKACITFAPQLKDGEKPEAFMLTHLLDPTPTEIHVWLSLKHRQPAFISTEKLLWTVEGARISVLDRMEK